MGWLLSATRRGRRGYFARRARLERGFMGGGQGRDCETEQTFRWRAFFVWGARCAKYPRRPRRVALWGDLGGVQFSVTEVNREGRAPARP